MLSKHSPPLPSLMDANGLAESLALELNGGGGQRSHKSSPNHSVFKNAFSDHSASLNASCLQVSLLFVGSMTVVQIDFVHQALSESGLLQGCFSQLDLMHDAEELHSHLPSSFLSEDPSLASLNTLLHRSTSSELSRKRKLAHSHDGSNDGDDDEDYDEDDAHDLDSHRKKQHNMLSNLLISNTAHIKMNNQDGVDAVQDLSIAKADRFAGLDKFSSFTDENDDDVDDQDIEEDFDDDKDFSDGIIGGDREPREITNFKSDSLTTELADDVTVASRRSDETAFTSHLANGTIDNDDGEHKPSATKVERARSN